VVANLEFGDSLTERNDLAGAFVAADHRERYGHRTVVGVFVGVAHAGSEGLDQYLAGLGIIELYLFDTPWGVHFSQHRSSGLHGNTFPRLQPASIIRTPRT